MPRCGKLLRRRVGGGPAEAPERILLSYAVGEGKKDGTLGVNMFASEADVLAYVKTNPVAVSPVLLCGPKSLKEASRVHDVEGGDDNQAKDSGAAFVIESDEGQVDNCDENTYCGNSVETPRTRRLSRRCQSR